MKNLFSIILIFTILSLLTPSISAQTTVQEQSLKQQQVKKLFEKRLNLSQKQKEKARIIHQKGKKQISPIMYKIELNNQEIEKIKQNSNLSEKEKQEKINQIFEENKKLRKQAIEIRRKNSQEFEAILNKKQKEELAKMKAEGRAKFEKNHTPRPPFAGLGPQNFLGPRPLLPYNNNLRNKK